MTPNRLAAIPVRWSIAVLFAILVFASGAQAQPAQAATAISINGVYNGTYAGDQGPIKFKLSLTLRDNGILAGEFTLYLAEGSTTNAYTCELTGRFIPANRMVQLRPVKWETAQPSGVVMAGMNGVFDPDGGNGAGQISGKMRARPGPKFEAIRDADESAKMASAATQPASPPTVSKAAAPAPPASQAPGTFIARTAIDGVYTGTYGSNPDDNVSAKLYIKFIDDGSVNGTLNGLFTFDVPPSPGAKPVTYTYKLTGTYATGTIQFWSAKPLGKPAPDAYAVTQLSLSFDKTPLVKGRDGQLEFNFNPDQISGPVIGSNNRPNNKFEAKRDKAESANLDSLMASQASAAGSVVSTAAPAVAPAAVPAATVVRPSIEGVFNGTFTRANEPPTKFKLTITRTPDGLAGVATIYLPTDAGTKAYTYSLKGALDGYGAFHLFVLDWDTIPPKDFKDFKAMGFNGTLRSNMNQNTARIISVPASGSLASLVVPKFEATWDATESADINGAIAAQKAVGDTDQVAALQARAEVLKNAIPKQLASKDLVRKSQAYWDGYRSDFIREVFDGGFASDVDDDPAFESLFTDYVDLFSKNCAAYLPADHKTVTITTVTTTTRGGTVIETKTTSKTVEVDSRFIPKYVEFSGVEPAPGSEQEKEQTAKTIAIAGQILRVGGPSHGTSPADANALLHLMAAHGVDPMFSACGQDMDKFFATEVKATGPSAALRQMGENLLRGATGEPSLQEAGGKIDGAEAETDKDLPPGRFARLIDAANAFYRDPANARFKGRFETAFDETLAAKYQGVMTRDEEYYYANDFGPRFRDQIMQDREHCADPAWPRLHPAVEECVAEIK
jgi:hypothetical protein